MCKQNLVLSFTLFFPIKFRLYHSYSYFILLLKTGYTYPIKFSQFISHNN